MDHHTNITLKRDCDAILIPAGTKITLPKSSPVMITQSLGGSYTVATEYGLARIIDADADALGLEPTIKPPPAGTEPAELDEKAVWDQLKTCYDPEIPVNIVDLGLVYDCRIEPQPTGGAKVSVQMTLTAPGCGMGPTICAEAKQKIEALPGVAEADVQMVWDPPWNQSMISEVGQMKLGLI